MMVRPITELWCFFVSVCFIVFIFHNLTQLPFSIFGAKDKDKDKYGD